MITSSNDPAALRRIRTEVGGFSTLPLQGHDLFKLIRPVERGFIKHYSLLKTLWLELLGEDGLELEDRPVVITTPQLPDHVCLCSCDVWLCCGVARLVCPHPV